MRLLEITLAVTILAGCATGGAETSASGAAPYHMTADGRRDLDLAEGYLAMNQVEKAADWAAKALASDPDSADVHALSGIIASRSGDAKRAGAEFDRALKLAPNSGPILNAHASWLCEHGQAEQADQQFVRALQDPNYIRPLQALSNAGKCALGAGQLAKAEGYFRRALAIAPQDRSLLFLMADTEFRQGKIMEAQAFIQRRDDEESSAETLELAARIEDAAGDRLAAARYRKRLQVEFPDYAPTGEGAKQP